jgi:hypothetical protein
VNGINQIGLNTIAISVLTAALIWLGTAYWRLRTAREDKAKALALTAEDVQKQLGEFRNQLQLLGQAVQPITAAMSAVLVKSLTHFHKPKVDALLAKVGPPCTLSLREEHDLACEMQTVMSDVSIPDLERNSARLLLLIVERSRLEGANDKPADLALVGIPRAHE